MVLLAPLRDMLSGDALSMGGAAGIGGVPLVLDQFADAVGIVSFVPERCFAGRDIKLLVRDLPVVSAWRSGQAGLEALVPRREHGFW